MSKSEQPANVAVDRGVRPRAWLTREPDGNDGDGSYSGVYEGVELGAERPDFGTEPLYDQAALDAAVVAERERYETVLKLQQASYEREIQIEVAAERERWRAVLSACDAALGQCEPCAAAECGAVQREYIETARAAAARMLRA